MAALGIVETFTIDRPRHRPPPGFHRVVRRLHCPILPRHTRRKPELLVTLSEAMLFQTTARLRGLAEPTPGRSPCHASGPSRSQIRSAENE